MTAIHLHDISFTRDGADTIHYRTGGIPQADSGEDAGRLMIRVKVDGDLTIVHVDLGESGEVAMLDLAIAELQRLRTGVAGVLADSDYSGRCFSFDDWGRCRSDLGHDGEHSYPAEADWRSRNNLLAVMAVEA